MCWSTKVTTRLCCPGCELNGTGVMYLHSCTHAPMQAGLLYVGDVQGGEAVVPQLSASFMCMCSGRGRHHSRACVQAVAGTTHVHVFRQWHTPQPPVHPVQLLLPSGWLQRLELGEGGCKETRHLHTRSHQQGTTSVHGAHHVCLWVWRVGA